LENKIINMLVIVEDTFHKNKNSERHMAIFYWLRVNCPWIFKGSLGLTKCFSKDGKIPEFLEILKNEHLVGRESLQPKDLKQILRDMRVDDEEIKLWFKKLMWYYLVDQLLLCSSNTKYLRKSLWRLLEDLKIFDKVKWAKVVHDHIHEALWDLKGKMDKDGEAWWAYIHRGPSMFPFRPPRVSIQNLKCAYNQFRIWVITKSEY